MTTTQNLFFIELYSIGEQIRLLQCAESEGMLDLASKSRQSAQDLRQEALPT